MKLSILFLLFTTVAHAQTNPPDPTKWGCAVPVVAGAGGMPSGPQVTIDPSHSLADAIAKATSGTTINLKSGNYGDVLIKKVKFAGFVTVQPLPGEHPVLASLQLASASHLIFKGLKIQSQLASGQRYKDLVLIASRDQASATDNIILDGNDVSSVDDSHAWSVQDWKTKSATKGIVLDSGIDAAGDTSFVSCITVKNNSVHDIRFGINVMSGKTLVTHNTVNRYGDDAMDYSANKIVISYNTITNSVWLDDGNHPDAMQGRIGNTTKYHDVLIDHNTVTRNTDPTLKLTGSTQGIDTFDGDWYNITVTNNTVTTDIRNAITFGGVHTANISNNIVMHEHGTTTRPSQDSMSAITLALSNGTSVAPSDHIVANGNVSDYLAIAMPAVTSNIIARDNRAQRQFNYQDASGKGFFMSKPGVYNSGSESNTTVVFGQ